MLAAVECKKRNEQTGLNLLKIKGRYKTMTESEQEYMNANHNDKDQLAYLASNDLYNPADSVDKKGKTAETPKAATTETPKA